MHSDGLDRDALDRHIEGGRYDETACDLVCPECHLEFDGAVCREYGMSWLEPEVCPACGADARIKGKASG